LELRFEAYRPRRLVNVHRRVDPWFWDRYSAFPYIGCRSGCTFCYLRGSRYARFIDPDRFDTHIRVKLGAPELLKKELSRLEPDVIHAGDWQQPAESRYRLSRKMLEVVLELGFPLLIIERSPLLTRDLDLLVEIRRRSWVFVLISISSLDPALKRAFEPKSPGLSRRLALMEALAEKGIPVGLALMPVFPYLSDDPASLAALIRAARDHGASVVLAGTLTMDGPQAVRTLEALRQYRPDLEERWRDLYRWHGARPAYAPPRGYAARLGRQVWEIAEREGLKDRLPRYVPPGPKARNRKLAEYLHLKAYRLDLEEAPGFRAQAYHRAAWTLDDLERDVAAIHREKGEAGLMALPGFGPAIAAEAARWLKAHRWAPPTQSSQVSPRPAKKASSP